MTWRYMRKWGSVVAICGIVALLGTCWIVGGALVAPATRAVGPPPADFPASAVQIESDSGAVLAGWHLALPDSKACVILLHPIRGDRRSMLSRARLFRKHGYSTLLVDLQAHGESAGTRITLGHLEKHDVRAAVDFVREQQPEQKVVLVGRSLGGASALLAQPSVDGLVVESVFPSISEGVHNRIQTRMGALHYLLAPLLLVQLETRLGVAPAELCPIDQLEQLECPVVVASGDHDAHTTLTETRRMFAAANGPKRLVVFEGAAHVDLLDYDPSKYENEIVGYVNQFLGESMDELDLPALRQAVPE